MRISLRLPYPKGAWGSEWFLRFALSTRDPLMAVVKWLQPTKLNKNPATACAVLLSWLLGSAPFPQKEPSEQPGCLSLRGPSKMPTNTFGSKGTFRPDGLPLAPCSLWRSRPWFLCCWFWSICWFWVSPTPQCQGAAHTLEHAGLTWQDGVAAGSFQNMTPVKIWAKCFLCAKVWGLHRASEGRERERTRQLRVSVLALPLNSWVTSLNLILCKMMTLYSLHLVALRLNKVIYWCLLCAG